MVGGSYKKVHEGQLKGDVANGNCSKTDWHPQRVVRLHHCKIPSSIWMPIFPGCWRGKTFRVGNWYGWCLTSCITLYTGYVLFVSIASFLWGATLPSLHMVGKTANQSASFNPPTAGEAILPILANLSIPSSLTTLIGSKNDPRQTNQNLFLLEQVHSHTHRASLQHSFSA